MFDRVVFPTDGSDAASDVLDFVLDIAVANGAALDLLHVADTTRDSDTRIEGEVVDVLEREGEDVVADAADRARQREVEVVTEVLQGHPYRVIVDYAESVDADLVVMPTHGRTGLERLLLGSTTDRVVRLSDVPVLTLRPDAEARYPFENVLVPTDGSDSAGAALERAVDVTTAEGAALHLLSVVDVAGLGVDVRANVQVDALQEAAEATLSSAAGVATDAGVESVSTTVEFGTSIHGAILDYVEDNDVDLLVVGTHGRTGFDRYLLGSVTEKLVRTSPVPVLTVRGPADGG